MVTFMLSKVLDRQCCNVMYQKTILSFIVVSGKEICQTIIDLTESTVYQVQGVGFQE